MGGGILDLLGTGGGTDGADRAGIRGGPEVVVVVGWTGGMTTFGLGGMYGASVSPSSAIFGATMVGVVEGSLVS